MPTFSHDGLSFRYLDKGQGLPVVFQHGLGADADQSFGLLDPPPGFRLLTLDCRGHGSTQPLGALDKISVQAFAHDIQAWLDHLGLRKAVVGGTSMGAAVALEFALAHPQRILGLILSRPAWTDQPRTSEQPIFCSIAAHIRDYGAARGKEIFAGTPEYLEIVRQFPATAPALLAHFDRPRAEETVAKLERISGYVPTHHRSAWRKLCVPTLVLANRQDQIHPFEAGLTLAQSIPGAELRELTPKPVSVEAHNEDVQRFISEFLLRHFGAQT